MNYQHHDTDTATASTSERRHGVADHKKRWTLKPEHVMILEAIFDSGMMNPSKAEIVRIRILLEQFGAVGNTNILFWFQNRRSKFRRHQRQNQADAAVEQLQAPPPPCCGGGFPYYGNTVLPGGFLAAPPLPNYHFDMGPPCFMGSCSSSAGEIHDGNISDGHLFGFSSDLGPFQQFDQSSNFCSGDASDFQYCQSGYCSEMITVFINGMAMEVERGVLLDVATIFDVDNFMLVDAYGFLVESLQHGESYFLVPREC